MAKRIVPIVLILIGFVIAIYPSFTGRDAYYAGDNFYISMVDSVDLQYEPFLEDIIQSKRNKLAFKEKKAFRETLKPINDSLDRVYATATQRKDSARMKRINSERELMNMNLLDKESQIDQKYAVSNMDSIVFNKQLEALKSEITKEDFILITANELLASMGKAKDNEFKKDDIQTQVVNRQDFAPFLYSGSMILIVGIFLLLFVEGVLTLATLGMRVTFGLVFFSLCVLMGYNIYTNINDRLEFERTLNNRKSKVIDRLEDIKKLQVTYLEEKGKYTSSWDSLVNFAQNDSVKIVKYLVNKDDTAAVNQAKRKGLPLEEIVYVPVMEKAFDKKIGYPVQEIKKVPFSDKTFELNAGTIEKNGSEIQVIEVKTSWYTFVESLSTVPANFDKDRKLVLGSMTEPTTEGNW